MAEVASGIIGQHGLAEDRLKRILEKTHNLAKDLDYINEVKWARKVRNRIVHEGAMPTTDGEEHAKIATRMKDIVFPILRILDPMLKSREDT